MSQKQAKRLRKRLREENVLDYVVKDAQGKPMNPLMRRLDPNPKAGEIDPKIGSMEPLKKFRGGAIYAKDCLRGVYLTMKKRQKASG